MGSVLFALLRPHFIGMAIFRAPVPGLIVCIQ
ncbi:hypothetical protein SAMN05192543_106223 [Paraburkholderia megapolitana]|uniref:Uncharacterized protein n=1 Tax=Paraburkholderia megapolitana TaxID=420953 RepID=A0A1I3Q4K9_9BURK|nr:hypothetical protein SAMN05192543_106223 [Paraburkholderia megapolitana]